MDALALLDKLETAPAESEKQMLYDAFTQRVAEGNDSVNQQQPSELTREQFKAFAADIGTQPALSDAELDEIWSQVREGSAL